LKLVAAGWGKGVLCLRTKLVNKEEVKFRTITSFNAAKDQILLLSILHNKISQSPKLYSSLSIAIHITNLSFSFQVFFFFLSLFCFFGSEQIKGEAAEHRGKIVTA
jgi:hypothetical protein